MSSFPIFEPGDILIAKTTGNVWRVTNIVSSEPNGVVVSQTLTVSQVDAQKAEGTLIYPGEESE